MEDLDKQITTDLISQSSATTDHQHNHSPLDRSKDTSDEINHKIFLVKELEDIQDKLRIGLEDSRRQIAQAETELVGLRTGGEDRQQILENDLSELRQSEEEIFTNLVKVGERISSERDLIREMRVKQGVGSHLEDDLESVISHLQCLVNHLEGQIQEKDEENKRLLHVNDELMKTLFNFEQKINEKQNIINENKQENTNVHNLAEENTRLNNLVNFLRGETTPDTKTDIDDKGSSERLEEANSPTDSEWSDSQISNNDRLLKTLLSEIDKLKSRINDSVLSRTSLVRLMLGEVQCLKDEIQKLKTRRDLTDSTIKIISKEQKLTERNNFELSSEISTMKNLLHEKDLAAANIKEKNKALKTDLTQKTQKMAELETQMKDLTDFRDNLLEIVKLSDLDFHKIITEKADVREAGNKVKICLLLDKFFKNLQNTTLYCNRPEHNKVSGSDGLQISEELERLKGQARSQEAEESTNQTREERKLRLSTQLDQINDSLAHKMNELKSIEEKIVKNEHFIERQNTQLREMEEAKIKQEAQMDLLTSRDNQLRFQKNEADRMTSLALMEAQKQKNVLEGNRSKLTQEREKLKKIINIIKKKNKEYDDLVSDCEQVGQTILSLKTEASDISERTLKSYTNLEDLDGVILERTIHLKQLEETVSNEEETLRTLKSSRVSMEHDYDLMVAQNEERVSQLTKSLTQLEIRLENSECDLKTKTENLANSRQEHDDILLRIEKETSKLGDLQSKVSLKEEELSVLDSERKEREREIQELIREKEGELTVLDNIRSHQAKLVNQKEEEKSINGRVCFEREKREINELECLSNTRKDHLKRIVDDVEECQNRLRTLNGEVKEVSGEVGTLTQHKSVLEEQLQMLTNKCSQLGDLREQYEQEILNMEAQVIEGRRTCDIIREEYEKYDQRLSSLFDEIYIKTRQLDELRQICEDGQYSFPHIDSLHSHIARLEWELECKDSQLRACAREEIAFQDVCERISECGQSIKEGREQSIHDLQRIRCKLKALENIYSTNEDWEARRFNSVSSQSKRPTRDMAS